MSGFSHGSHPLDPKKKRDRDDDSSSVDDVDDGPRRSSRTTKKTKQFGDLVPEEDLDIEIPLTASDLREMSEEEAREEANAEGDTRGVGGKIPGESRCDTVENPFYPWSCPNNRWSNVGNFPIKTARRIIQAVPTVFERKPSQLATMWEVTTGKIQIHKDWKIQVARHSKPRKSVQKLVSPNELAGYLSFKSNSNASYEWLHLIANSFGGPDSTRFQNSTTSTINGSQGNPAQTVANLVLGTHSANTFMMAIEFAVDRQVGIHYHVEAFCPSDFHIAEWIRVSICKVPYHGRPQGTAAGKCRHYWIDAKLQCCPLKAYAHMKADAVQFVANDAGFLPIDSVYTYLDPPW